MSEMSERMKGKQMSSNTWQRSFYTSMIERLLLLFHNNEFDNLDKERFIA